MAEPHATAVFRIVQEALVNVAKHAKASRVEVCLAHKIGEMTLSVCDNGQGFDTAAPRAPHSLGIMGLRERTHLLRGALDIESRQGQGTCVRVRIPVPPTKGKS